MIVFVGEALGQDEVRYGAPFVGPSGIELLRMLGEAGVIQLSSFDRDYMRRYYSNADLSCTAAIWDLHPELHRTNVFNLHPPRNDLEFFCGPRSEGIPGFPALVKSKYVRAEFSTELDRLGDELLALNPNLVICLGNTSLWALTGRTGVTKIRGTTLLSTHTVAGFKLLSTFHPAAVLRQWELRPTVIADLMKAAREAEYPEIRRPHRGIWIEPTIEDVETFVRERIHGCDLLSVDIETVGQRITCIGFGPSASEALVIPFDDPRSANGSYWPTREAEIECWNIVRSVLGDGSIPKLFQNGLYDISFLWRSYGIKTIGATHDTMLLSHALHPESLKGLGYLGSIYSDEGSWKHMRKKHETIKRDN